MNEIRKTYRTLRSFGLTALSAWRIATSDRSYARRLLCAIAQ